jgi:hypothetical protein
VDVAPRLTAAGADLERVHLVVEHFVLPAHLHRLLDLAVEIGDVGMLLIDPLSNHMEKADSNAETAVRFAIGGLNRMADELDCCILGVRHLGKHRQNGALVSVLGSTAWCSTSRSSPATAPAAARRRATGSSCATFPGSPSLSLTRSPWASRPRASMTSSPRCDTRRGRTTRAT